MEEEEEEEEEEEKQEQTNWNKTRHGKFQTEAPCYKIIGPAAGQ